MLYWEKQTISRDYRHKEHTAGVKHRRFDRSALTRHVFDLGHTIDWQDSKVLKFKCDFHKRRFIESFYINTERSSMNDNSSDVFPDTYRFLINK